MFDAPMSAEPVFVKAPVAVFLRNCIPTDNDVFRAARAMAGHVGRFMKCGYVAMLILT